MSHASLTAKYRPQTFAQIAGQDTLKAILSRASLERRVAPAYLFSGTRGVGKTTLARIFAKALNCRTGPTAEPCNQCDQCRSITAGNAVDVVEIDGASNRGIDDVRRLREVVGYAPMEGAYKIFIIDEAHMLSREAFNALLKTLEEPPARVTFIMATTEPHKFPATIISRCQHYVFKRLPEGGLVAHLADVLSKEGIAFEDSAVRLIARRGAGSVRDAMSLLGQVLALREGRLTEDATRSVLGLAGQEAFLSMLDSFRTGDSLTLSRLLREMLDQGLDMGFFLRELSSLWRNLFMLRQSGEAALSVVELPENEARAYLEAASAFSLQHIHACWQMTLEGQRRVLTSLEPALALELLLLNLGMLPQLLSLESLSTMGRRGGQSGSGSAAPSGGQSGMASGTGQGAGPAQGNRAFSHGTAHAGQPVSEQGPSSGLSGGPPPLDRQEISIPTAVPSLSVPEPERFSLSAEEDAERNFSDPDPEEAAIQEALRELSDLETAKRERDLPEHGTVSEAPGIIRTEKAAVEARNAAQESPESGDSMEDPRPESHQKDAVVPLPRWDTIFPLCADLETPAWLVSLLRRVEARTQDNGLTLKAGDGFVAERLREPQARAALNALLEAWCGVVPPVEITARDRPVKSRDEVKAEVQQHPLVKEVEAHLGAYIVDYGQIRS